MSRLNFGKEEESSHFVDLETGIYWNAENGVSWEQLVKETSNDKMLRCIMKRVADSDWKTVSPAETPYKRNQQGLCVENGVLILGTRPVIPELLRNSLMAAAHSEHFGMSTTKLHLRRNVWWPGMDKDVERFVGRCNECAKKPKSNIVSNRFKWEMEELPFRRVHMDWCFIPKVGEVIILVDAYSGWPEAFLCKNRCASSVLRILKSVFARFGVPLMLVTDNAKEFISEDVVVWLRKIGCEKVQTPQYSPRSNGCVERMVQTIKRAMRLWSIEKGEFMEYLQKVLLTYRTSRVAGQRTATPAEMIFSFNVRHPLLSFDTNEKLLYTKKPGEKPVDAEFILQNSLRTMYV